MELVVEAIIGAVTILGLAGAWLVTWGRLRETVKGHAEQFERVWKTVEGLATEDEMNSIVEQMREIKVAIKEADNKRDAAREDQHKELRDISERMGQIKQFMENSKVGP